MGVSSSRILLVSAEELPRESVAKSLREKYSCTVDTVGTVSATEKRIRQFGISYHVVAMDDVLPVKKGGILKPRGIELAKKISIYAGTQCLIFTGTDIERSFKAMRKGIPCYPVKLCDIDADVLAIFLQHAVIYSRRNVELADRYPPGWKVDLCKPISAP